MTACAHTADPAQTETRGRPLKRLREGRLGRSKVARRAGLGMGALGVGAILAGCMAWSPEPTDLGMGAGSEAVAINDNGWVVGSGGVWHDGRTTALATLGGTGGGPTAINNRNWIVGSSQTSAGDYHAALWQGSNVTDLGTLGGKNSRALAINASGWVVGISDTTSGAIQFGTGHGFLWHDGTMTDLTAVSGTDFVPTGISDTGTIAGNHHMSTDPQSTGTTPSILKGTNVTDLPLPSPDSFGTAGVINGQGDVVGVISNIPPVGVEQVWHLVIWKHDGTMTEVARASTRGTIIARAINNADQVVYNIPTPGPGPFYSAAVSGSNNNFYPPCAPPACSNQGRGAYLSGINNHGVIVGKAEKSVTSGTRGPYFAALWTPSGSLP